MTRTAQSEALDSAGINRRGAALYDRRPWKSTASAFIERRYSAKVGFLTDSEGDDEEPRHAARTGQVARDS
jgi:hypothetical protein